MSDLEKLLSASIEISQLKREAKLSADAITALSSEVAFLRASLSARECQLRIPVETRAQ